MSYKDYLSEEPFMAGDQSNLVIVKNMDGTETTLYVNNQLLTPPIIASQLKDAINDYFSSNVEAISSQLFKLYDDRERELIKVFKNNLSKNIFKTSHHKDGANALPQFEIRDKKVFSTVHHDAGKSAVAQYEIKQNQLFKNTSHKIDKSANPQFEIRGNKLFRVANHQEDISDLPVYEIRYEN